MEPCSLQPFLDSPSNREALVTYLCESETDATLNRGLWQRRLVHWWDENPFASEAPARGWTLISEGRIVGFQGLIPSCYWAESQVALGYISTTWRIDDVHRNQGLPMLMQLRRLGQQHLLMDTTPTADVQKLLAHTGWTAINPVTRRVVLAGGLRAWWPEVPPSLRFITDPTEVKDVAGPKDPGSQLIKRFTPDSLCWYARSVMRKHLFAGLVDAAGSLQALVFLTPGKIRGLPALQEVDHFAADGGALLLPLMGKVLVCRDLLGCHMIVGLNSFEGDAAWSGARSVLTQTITSSHFGFIPQGLRHLRKLTVMAEGDWGL